MKFFLFSLQIMPGTFLILRRNEQDIIINVRMYSRKVPAIYVIF